jgi:hypothetical protein
VIPKREPGGSLGGSNGRERPSILGGVITPEDAEFHPPTGSDRMWAETNYFGFEIPQVPMHIGLYALFRPNLGVVNSAVFANSRRVTASWEIDFWDSRAYLPMPSSGSLLDYRLDNGLSVRCLEPNRVWELRYESDALSVDVRYEALMEPFDIHDPDMDPRSRNARSDLSAGAAYAGHFDMTGAVTGTVVVNGVRHRVDSMSTMDHSWGVREERQLGVMTWLQAHFSRDLAVHAMFDFDPTIGPDRPFDVHLTHGYVMDHGKGVGLREGAGHMTRKGMYTDTLALQLLDDDGREWTLTGEAQTQFPCQYWPGSMAFMVLPRWRMGDLVGHGTSTDFLDLHHFTALYR